MKKTLFGLLFIASLANATDYFDPMDKYDMTKLYTNKTTVTVRVVSDVQAECEKESRRVGNNGFGNMVQACSFWIENSCTIILPKKASQFQLGHEMMHCIKGNFH